MFSTKKMLKRTLERIGLKVERLPASDRDLERLYVSGGRRPWSVGYEQAKHRFVGGIISNPARLAVFRTGSRLPDGFGVGLDERCVEYPWLLAHLPVDAQRILDAGSALNHAFILDHLLLGERRLHILTLSPEPSCFWHRGISYLFDDLRSIPIQDNYYDAVACISTLEHVGFDNTMYTHSEAYREYTPDAFVSAMQALCRVLRPGGSLFLTVPFGVYKNLGFSQQFDEVMLARAIQAFGPASEVNNAFFCYAVGGWQMATAEDCVGCEYVDWYARACQRQQWPDPIPVEPDRAAAARAVACVQIIKA